MLSKTLWKASPTVWRLDHLCTQRHGHAEMGVAMALCFREIITVVVDFFAIGIAQRA